MVVLGLCTLNQSSSPPLRPVPSSSTAPRREVSVRVTCSGQSPALLLPGVLCNPTSTECDQSMGVAPGVSLPALALAAAATWPSTTVEHKLSAWPRGVARSVRSPK